MSFTEQISLEIIGNAQRELAKIAVTLERVKREAEKTQQTFAQTFSKNAKMMREFGNNVSLKVGLPLGALGGFALKSAAEMESIETAFVGILGGAQKARQMVEKLFEFSAETPFQLPEISQTAGQLLVARVGVDEITNKLEMLGNIAAASRVPLSDIGAIYSKIQNLGRAQAEQLNQMAERSIPIVQTLSDILKVPPSEIYELGAQSKLTAPIIERAFQRMSEEGNFANKALILQSKTMSGVFTTLKDNINLTSATLGNVFLPETKKLAIFLIEATKNLRAFLREHPILAKFIVGFMGIGIAIGPLISGLAQLGLAMIAFQALSLKMALLNPFLGIIAATAIVTAGVSSLIYLFVTLKNNMEFFMNLADKFLDATEKMFSIDKFYDLKNEQIQTRVKERSLEIFAKAEQIKQGNQNMQANMVTNTNTSSMEAKGKIMVDFVNAPKNTKIQSESRGFMDLGTNIYFAR